MKKIIALLMSMLLILGAFPTFVLAAEENEDKGENLALTAKITASSTHDNYPISNIIDGNLRSVWVRANYAQNEWIAFDLGQPYRISSVVMHFRLDQTADSWRQNVVLEFSNTPDFLVKERVQVVGEEASPYGEPVEVVDPSTTMYRYVRAVKTAVDQFVVAEMEIYGYIPDPNAASYKLGEDVAGTRQEGPIKLLTYLGLVSNEDEDNFGVDNLLTRAQAAKMVVEAFGGHTDFVGNLPFKDVDKTHQNYQDVLNAYQLGYIQGDTESVFRPNDFVTKEELLIMTLRGMGYNNEVVSLMFQNSMAKLLKQADKLDLLMGVPMKDYSEPVSRGDAAVVFYNALLAPELNVTGATEDNLIYEEDTNALKRRYNILLMTGIVEENRISTLNGEKKSGESGANVSGTSLVDRSGALDHYLGKSVVVAVDADKPNQILLAWTTDNNQEVVLNSSSLITGAADIDANRIVAINESGVEKKYNLDKDFYVILNGIAHPFYTAEELMSPAGQIRLVSNDEDSSYEVVFIDDFSVHYLVGAFLDSEELTLLDSNGAKTVLEAASVKVSTPDGASANAKKLKEKMLVKVYNTPDGKNARVVYYNQPLSGKLQGKYGKEIVIDDVRYPLSVYYSNATKEHEPKLGDAVKFFIDEFGEILWMEADDKADSDWKIAFSQVCSVNPQVFTPRVMFRLFTEDGTWLQCEAAKKVNVDGTIIKINDLATKIKADKMQPSPIFEKEMLRFKLDSSGMISAIDTVQESQTEVEGGQITFTKMDKSLYQLALDTGYGYSCYTPESEGFWSQHQQILPAKQDALTFVLPRVNGAFTTDSSYDSLYQISSLIDQAGNRSNNAHSNMHAYMQDENGYPECFIATQNFSVGAGGVVNAITSNSAPFFLVEEAGMTLVNDELVYCFTGWNISSQSKATIYAPASLEAIETGLLYQEEPECLSSQYHLVDSSAFMKLSDEERANYICQASDIGFGDIIRYQSQGTTVGVMERVFDYDASAEPVFGDDRAGDSWYTTGNNPTLHRGDYRFQFGEFSKITADAFKLKDPAGHEATYKKTAFQKTLLCEASGKTSSVSEVKDLYQYAGSDYRVMTYTYIGAPRIMIIYQY